MNSYEILLRSAEYGEEVISSYSSILDAAAGVERLLKSIARRQDGIKRELIITIN